MRLIFAFILSVLANNVLGQTTDFAKKTFALLNEARSNPQTFYTKYKSKVDQFVPDYGPVLQKAKPQAKLLWDSGLEDMAKSVVVNKNLNPKYNGSADICGIASGKMTGNLEDDPFEYLALFYMNLHTAAYTHIGFYKTSTGFSFQMGQGCDENKVEYTFTEKIDSSKVDFKKLNTAVNVSYLTEEEKRMVLEINFARAYPKVYAQIVKKYLADQSASVFGLDEEEYEVGLELIDVLNSMSPASILQPHECVYKAAKQHGLDCKKRGFFDHTGSDGSNPWDRVLRNCSSLEDGNENGYGGSGGARVAVISLLIDDGVSSRGHRTNMLNPEWVYVSCYKWTDPVYKFHWVQVFGK